MMLAGWLDRRGFDPARLGFTLRTAVAVCLAILAGWGLGLEHPQWAGMTVWAASQPVRGLLLEKSVFRVLGTIVGALYGIGLVALAHGEIWIVVTGLSLWIGLCTGAGNLARGFVSYGVMLAGYSAAMVTLLHDPGAGSNLEIGVDRMLTVLVGVLTALVVGWAFASAGDRDGLARRVFDLSARILDDLAARLDGARDPGAPEVHDLLAEMAAIEEGMDGHAAGSLRSREEIRRLRWLMTAEVAAILWLRRVRSGKDRADLSAALRAAARDLRAGASPSHVASALATAAERAADEPALRDVLVPLADAFGRFDGAGDGADALGGAPPVIALHRDWVGARQSFIRAIVVSLSAGLLWLVTGLQAGAFMMLGTAIMTTLFSTMENPAHFMRYVIAGQVLGGLGALACRWLVWPLAGTEIGLIAGLVPFVVVGAFLLAHRRTALVGFDYNMVMLLLLRPALPLTGSFAESMIAVGAVVLGPVVALVAYRVIFPMSGGRRLRTLQRMMVNEVAAMAGRDGVSRHRPVWRARLYHRVLRLVRWADRSGGSRRSVVDGAIAVLMLGSAVVHLDELAGRVGARSHLGRRLAVARARIGKIAVDPGRAARALRLVAASGPGQGVDDGLLSLAAAELDANRAIFLSR